MLFVVIPPVLVIPDPLRATFSPGNAFRDRFQAQKSSARPILRNRHYVAPQNQHKADFARIFALSARTLCPEPAAFCAIDPPPHFRYPFANQEKSPRHVMPTSYRPNITVGAVE